MKKLLGLLAVAGLLAVVAPSVPAQALSLNTPGIAAAVQGGSDGLVTEVRGGRGHGRGHGFGRHGGRGHHFGWNRGRGHHYGWHRGRGHHYGWHRGRRW